MSKPAKPKGISLPYNQCICCMNFKQGKTAFGICRIGQPKIEVDGEKKYLQWAKVHQFGTCNEFKNK